MRVGSVCNDMPLPQEVVDGDNRREEDEEKGQDNSEEKLRLSWLETEDTDTSDEEV